MLQTHPVYFPLHICPRPENSYFSKDLSFLWLENGIRNQNKGILGMLVASGASFVLGFQLTGQKYSI